jgi:hypothetical protein
VKGAEVCRAKGKEETAEVFQVSPASGWADRFKVQGSRLRKEKIPDLPKKASIRPV